MGDGKGVAVFDVVSNTHLASLPLPPAKKGSLDSDLFTQGLLISADGQHIAAQLRDGQVQVYDHVGTESRWGLMRSPWFGVMAAIIAVIVYSLWRDARKQARISGPCRAVAGMVIASVPTLIMLCGRFGFARSSDEFFDQSANFATILLALWLPAGLCIRAGSGVWKLIGSILLCLAAIYAFIESTSAAVTANSLMALK